MRYDEKTKVIGRREIMDENPEAYSEFNNAYEDNGQVQGDEFSYLDGDESINEEPINTGVDNPENKPEEKAEVVKAKPKKKKSKKGLIIALIIILLLAAAGGAWALVSQTAQEEVNVDLVEVMNQPEVSGCDGEAELSEVTLNQDKVAEITNAIEKDEQREKVVEFFASVEYTPDKTTNLVNGNTVEITANYDESLAEKANVTVTQNEYSYKVEGLKNKQEEKSKKIIKSAQWYRNVTVDGDEISTTCILIAEKGTSVTLPIGYMYCQADGAMAEMIDTTGEPDITYNGTGYFKENGYEPPVGRVIEVDNTHIKYSVKQYGESFTISVNYTINEDGVLNVESATGGEAPIPLGKYEQINSSMVDL